MKTIAEIAARLGIPDDDVSPYGRYFGKVRADLVDRLAAPRRGKLILVTAVTPTTHGEGKTVTTIGLAQALERIGKLAVATLRQPSLGPVFGQKGGATGGGKSQVVPHDKINYHFTGDFHAVSAAQNMLAALIDSHLYHGNLLDLDPLTIDWPRALDVNDRSLREVVTGLGGRVNGSPRQTGFVITAASELMAILGLAESLGDLRTRVGRIVVGSTRSGAMVRVDDLKLTGAILSLLTDALHPNLAQTTEGSPAFVHTGPFANIAHGTASVTSIRLALGLADYVVNETGFAADLGAEKFFDIVMPASGLRPAVAVMVASLRAVAAQSGEPGVTQSALERGVANLERHVENTRGFGVPVVVAVNRFPSDDPALLHWLQRHCENRLGVACSVSDVYGQGGEGGRDLAEKVVAAAPGEARPLYAAELPLLEKIRTVAMKVYRASSVSFEPAAASRLKKLQDTGFGHLPVCMAKTQYSFSDNAKLIGAPSGFTLNVSEAHLRAGAGFVTAVSGNISLMPGLGKDPAAQLLDVDAQGRVTGLSV
jgi:formate--tetrahydrofolate ligase